MQKFAIATNLGGISNRIKCLVSMLRLSDKYGRKTMLYWPLNHTCGARFSDLFESNISEVGNAELERIDNKDIKKIEEDSIIIKNYPQKYITNGTWRFLLTEEELGKYPFLKNKRESKESGIDLNFSDVPDEVKESIIGYLKKIKPLPSIMEKINDFQKKQDIRKIIGVHIRRGDFADRKVSPGWVSSDEKFIERMKEIINENSEIKFFLSTDSKEMENKMEKEFPNRIVKYPKANFIRTDIKSTQEGLVDLILLSRTKYILGTYRSTFNELAWWIGGCKAKVEIIKDIEKEKEFFRNTEKERRRIIPRIKRIILKIVKLKRKKI